MKQKIKVLIIGFIFSVVLIETAVRLGCFFYVFLREQRNEVFDREKNIFRILCIGESTTALGGRSSYPCQLQEILNQRNIGVQFSVINAGREGVNTTILIAQLENNLNKYQPDMIVAMMGCNDGRKTVLYGNIPFVNKFSFKTYKLVKLLWYNCQYKNQREVGTIASEDEKKFSKELLKRIISLKDDKEYSYRLMKYIEDKALAGFDEVLTELINVEPAAAVYRKLKRFFNCLQKMQNQYQKFEKILDRRVEIICKRCIKRDPMKYTPYLLLARCYINRRQYDKAQEVLNSAGVVKNSNLYLEKGWFYLEKEMYDQAEEMFKKVYELGKVPFKDIDTYLEYAWFSRREGKSHKAQEILKAIIERHPQELWAYFELGWLYKDYGKYEEAVRIFKDRLEFSPLDESIYSALSFLYEELGQYDLRDEYFKKARKLGLDKYSPITVYNYHNLKAAADRRRIKLVCVQYPMRSIEPLKEILLSHNDIIFVDNEKIFRDALRQDNYKKYFLDAFAGDFGHCAYEGNRLLAENIADVILKEVFLRNDFL